MAAIDEGKFCIMLEFFFLQYFMFLRQISGCKPPLPPRFHRTLLNSPWVLRIRTFHCFYRPSHMLGQFCVCVTRYILHVSGFTNMKSFSAYSTRELEYRVRSKTPTIWFTGPGTGLEISLKFCLDHTARPTWKDFKSIRPQNGSSPLLFRPHCRSVPSRSGHSRFVPINI